MSLLRLRCDEKVPVALAVSYVAPPLLGVPCQARSGRFCPGQGTEGREGREGGLQWKLQHPRACTQTQAVIEADSAVAQETTES